MTGHVRILEATIRDGGYMVDHHFSRLDLATIVGGLDRAGVSLIEVGHGNGVGSQYFRDPKLRGTILPLVDDAGHAEVALRVAKRARVGVVLTAGRRFAPIEYIDQIADLGFAFVRLAVMPDEVDDELFKYVRRAKDRGMLASINMMQTYARPPNEVGELAARAADHGLDWFYVVDSAGGMMVDDVKRYVSAILGAAKVEVGLHAHNNLGCAVANGIAAVDAGATLVDGTLNGIGRATGNPATEQLAVALRNRLADDIDLDALVALGNGIRSLFQEPGNDPFDFVSGGALVHSRNVPKIIDAAAKRDRSRGSFVISVGEEARRRGVLNAMSYSDELYDAVASTTSPVRKPEPTEAMLAVGSEEILGYWRGGAKRAIEELSLRSKQRHVPSVVHASRAAAALCDRAVPWQGTAGGVTLPWTDDTQWTVEPHHRPDYVILDEGDEPAPLAANVATWRVSFSEIYGRAVRDLCTSLRQAGQSLWCPAGSASDAERWVAGLERATGPRPAGAVAMVVAEDPAADRELTSGDVAIFVGRPVRDRVHALHARGVRVVQPRWTLAVAQAAESLITLRRELAQGAGDGLATAVDACGPGQAQWDPDRVALLDAEDPVAAARHAASEYVGSVLRGTRRL